MRRAAALLALLLAAAPGALRAQGSGWGPEVGGRAGFDLQNDAPTLGAFVGAHLAGAFSVQGGIDAVFLRGLTERQLGGELLYAAGRGLRIGAGPAWRTTIYGASANDSPRATHLGYTVAVVLSGAPGPGRTETGLEFRHSTVSGFRQQIVAIRVALPLGRRAAR